MKLIQPKLTTVGIPVIIQNNEGKILLGKREKNHLFYPNLWGLPGGIMDYNETPEETAKRESSEEMGIEIKIIKRSKNIYTSFPKKECKVHSIGIPFYAKIKKGNPEPLSETSQVKWFKPEEIKKLKLAYNHKEILKKEGLIK